MKEVRYRLAKPSDAKQIADCHWHVRDRYNEGIFLSLGKGFLRAYYEVILDDPNEIIVCAENKEGKIVGFSSGSLDAESQAKNLLNHKLKLGFAAILSLLRHPSYIRGVWERYSSLKPSNDKVFVYMKGARSEYLCWRKGEAGSIGMMLLDKIKFKLMHEFGVHEVFFEIDKQNERLFNAQQRMKEITLIGEFELPDGRKRGLFKKVLR